MGGCADTCRSPTGLLDRLARVDRFPGTSGFFSKDLLIERYTSRIDSIGYAYFCVLSGVFITALYTFRAFFMTFHGELRSGPAARLTRTACGARARRGRKFPPTSRARARGKDAHGDHDHGPPHESPAVVWVPLVLLAIPSAVIG